MHALLLLILLELQFACPQELRLSNDEFGDYFGLSNKDIEKVPEHQIVYIEHIATETTRHVTRDNIAEEAPSFKFRAFNEDFHIDVTKDNELFVEQTTSCRHLDGTGRVTVEQIPSDCFYRGSLRDNPKSLVSINTCAGITGTITREGHGDLYIEPLRDAHATKRGMQRGLGHVVYQPPENQPFECGVKDEANNNAYEPHTNIDESVDSEKFLKLHMVAEHQYFAYRGSESCRCLTATFHALVHRMALLPHLNVLLDGITIVETNTNLNTTLIAGDNLVKVRTWAASQPEKDQWDHVALIVPYYMNVGGTAWSCGVCGDNRFSVSYAAALYGVQVVAHEMGHNLCISHDTGGPGCGSGGYVMGGAGWATQEMGWTQCSIDKYNQHINTFSCLNDS